MSSDHAQLSIVFDLGVDPIAGVVHGGDADRGEPFAGWMELTRAIERGLAAARRAADAADADAQGSRERAGLHRPGDV